MDVEGAALWNPPPIRRDRPSGAVYISRNPPSAIQAENLGFLRDRAGRKRPPGGGLLYPVP